jgi:D-alanyl-D-alanine carboxypeptidase
LKTGYTEASGHNLVTSAVRGGVRLIGVVLGAASNGERDIHMASLLDQGFEQMDVPIARRAAPMASHVTLIASAHAAEAPKPPPHAKPANWAVQVGAYSTEAAARSAARAARRDADAGEVRVEAVRHKGGKTIWRASVIGLTQDDAEDACAPRRKSGCLLIRPGARQIASR